MSTSRFSPPDRIDYFDGQLLAARDLQDDVDGERALRGLHVRASHNTWGVALGFEVSWLEAALIQVGPGISYDAHGREIISAHTLNVGPPVRPVTPGESAWWFDLVISYRKTVERPGGEIGCFGGLRPGEESPYWRWCYAGAAPAGASPPAGISSEARVGEDVPLVRCRVTTAGLDQVLDFSVRRRAQGMVRPHVVGGQLLRPIREFPTPGFSTANALIFDSNQVAFTTSIDTSFAGFNQTPHYFARVTIPELLNSAGTASRILGPFVTLRAPNRGSFQLDIRVATNPVIIEHVAFMAAATTPAAVPVQITWLGIEANGGCVPPLDLLSGLFLFQPIEFFGLRMTPGFARGFTGGNNG